MKKETLRKAISAMTVISIMSGTFAFNAMAESSLTADVYADLNGVVLDFSEDVSAANLTQIKLYNGEAELSASAAVEADGDVALSADIQKNVVYRVSIPAGFTENSPAIEKKFVVKEVFSENFDDTVYNGGIVIGSAKDKVYDGALYLHDDTVYVKNTNNYKTYTLAYDVKSYQVKTGTNDDGSAKYEQHSPYSFRPFFTAEDKFFTSCEAYVWQIDNNPADNKTSINRGGPNHNADGSWSGYNAGQYNVNGAADSYAASLPEGKLSTTSSETTVPYAIAEETTGTTEFTVRKDRNLANLYIDGNYASSLNLGNLENSYFGIQDGVGQAAYIIDNIRMTVCYEPQVVNVTDIYADDGGVYLTFDKDVSAVDSVEGVSLTGPSGNVPFNASVNGKTVTIAAALDTNAMYRVTLGEEFGSGLLTVSEAYSKQFKIKEIALGAEDFSGATVVDNKATIANDGVMTLLKGNDKENYSLSFKLNVANAGNPNLRMWYNAITTGNFYSTSNKAYLVLFSKSKTILRPSANKYFAGDYDISTSYTQAYSDGSVIKLKKNGRNSDIYLNGAKIASYAPTETYTLNGTAYSFGTTGYFGIWNVSSEANGYTGSWPVTLSDVKMTYFAEYNPQPMTVESYYADKQGVMIDFSGNIADVDDSMVNSIEVSLNGDKLAIKDYKTEGDKLILNTANKLQLNSVYDVEIPAGFGTESLILENKYLAQFKLREEFVEDFADTVYNGGIVIGSSKDKVYDGALYLHADDCVYIKNTNNYKTYTLAYDVKSYQVKTGTNDDGSAKYEQHSPYSFRPFFTAEDKFFTSCEAYVWQIDNKPDNNKTSINRGGPNHNADGSWSGYNGGQYNVNGAADSYAASLPEGKLSTTSSETTVPYAIAEETTGTTEFTVRKDRNLANLYIDGNYASSLNLGNMEYGYFGIQDGAGQAAYIIDNIRMTVCEPVTSTIRTLKLTVKDASGNAINSVNGISYAKGEVLVKNYTNKAMPVVCVIAAYDANNKLLGAKLLKKDNIADMTQESYPYEFNNISNATEISAFCWDSFNTIVPYCNAVTVK